MTTEKPARRKATEKPAPAPEVEHVEPQPVVEHDVPEPAERPRRRGARSAEARAELLARGCPLGLVDGTDPDAVLID